MSVVFEQKLKSDTCVSFGVPNASWFWLLNNTGIGKIVNPGNTNDPIDASENESLQCAAVMRDVVFHNDQWCGPNYNSHKLRQEFITFFENCGGFRTY